MYSSNAHDLFGIINELRTIDQDGFFYWSSKWDTRHDQVTVFYHSKVSRRFLSNQLLE